MIRQKISRVTLVIDSFLTSRAVALIYELGGLHISLLRARQVTLQEQKTLFLFAARTATAEDRADIIRFYYPEEFVERIMNRLIHSLALLHPGRGSIFSEQVELHVKNLLQFDAEKISQLPATRSSILPYALVCCVVKRGEADILAQNILEMGLCVPAISYGEGMGMRSKLGLIRITIPIEKELVWLLVPMQDTSLAFDTVSGKLHLDRPGQGIIYMAPISAGAVNTRIFSDRRRHVATMEQIISVLDELRGSTEWRRIDAEQPAQENETLLDRTFTNLTILTNEGGIREAVAAAVRGGAGGATLREVDRIIDKGDSSGFLTRYREVADIVITDEFLPAVFRELETDGFFEKDFDGVVETNSLSKIFAYVSRKK